MEKRTSKNPRPDNWNTDEAMPEAVALYKDKDGCIYGLIDGAFDADMHPEPHLYASIPALREKIEEKLDEALRLKGPAATGMSTSLNNILALLDEMVGDT